MGSYSKQKGAAAERATAERLSLWATDLTRKDVFTRSGGSGSRFTQAQKTDRPRIIHDVGDIVALDPIGHKLTSRVVIECKEWDSLGLLDIVYGRKSDLANAWVKVRKEASTVGRVPMLIAKERRRDTLCAVGWCTYNELLRACRNERSMVACVVFPAIDFYAVAFSDVIHHVDYPTFVEGLRGVQEVDLASANHG